MLDDEPKDGEAKDLYLKGQDYVGNESINFDEKKRGDGHTGDGHTGDGDYEWRLTVYKSLDFELGEISGGDGNDYGEAEVRCGKGTFDVTGWNMRGGDEKHWTWEKAIS